VKVSYSELSETLPYVNNLIIAVVVGNGDVFPHIPQAYSNAEDTNYGPVPVESTAIYHVTTSALTFASFPQFPYRLEW